jgi:hypothetical protein
LASELRNDPWKVALAQFRGRLKRRLIMNKMIIPPVLAGLLTLGFALPAMADDTDDEATLTTVRSRGVTTATATVCLAVGAITDTTATTTLSRASAWSSGSATGVTGIGIGTGTND